MSGERGEWSVRVGREPEWGESEVGVGEWIWARLECESRSVSGEGVEYETGARVECVSREERSGERMECTWGEGGV